MSHEGQRWHESSPARRRAVAVLAVVELTLAAAAWGDLAHRPASQVRGPKWFWGLIIAVNFVGPLAYFTWGRLRDVALEPTDVAR